MSTPDDEWFPGRITPDFRSCRFSLLKIFFAVSPVQPFSYIGRHKENILNTSLSSIAQEESAGAGARL